MQRIALGRSLTLIPRSMNGRLATKLLHPSLRAEIKRCINSTAILREVVDFKLSDIGEGISEVTIKEWMIGVGSQVAQFDPICEVQSDKASVTITSRYDGVITKINYEIDTICKVGAALVQIDIDPGDGEGSVTVGGITAKEDPGAPDGKETQHAEIRTGKYLATPAVRRMVREFKLSLGDVTGTGKGGRVLKEDIQRHLNQPITLVTGRNDGGSAITDSLDRKITPLSVYTRAMVRSMSKSLSIPHFGLKDEVNITTLLELRRDLAREAKENHVRLSFLPILLKAASMALKQYPQLNASISDCQQALIMETHHNIGVAMDTPNGLIVPNIKNCEQKSILEIGRELNRLQEAAASGSIKNTDLEKTTFSLSNIGSIGGTYTFPLIVPPQVCIGALGRVRKLPRYNSGGDLVPRQILYISWSADHRVIDGATMCRFSNRWKDLLETPGNLLLHLK